MSPRCHRQTLFSLSSNAHSLFRYLLVVQLLSYVETINNFFLLKNLFLRKKKIVKIFMPPIVLALAEFPKFLFASQSLHCWLSPRRRDKELLSGSWKEMDAFKPVKTKNAPKHRPLTPLRSMRGFTCLLVFLSTSLMFLLYFGPPVALLMRLISIHHCRKTTSFLFSIWLALWPFLFEKINGTKVIFSGDTVPSGERVLIIANHRTEVDWMYLWDLALRKGCLGSIKYILKSSLMKLPVFGWGFHILEFIPVERKWEVDEPVLYQALSTFKDPRDPLWLAVFPEGTDFTEQKCQKSQKYAAEVGLPVLTNVLLPKARGFCVCLEVLQASLDAVYDVSIAYKHQCPSFLDNVFGVDPSEVHIHIRRIPIKEIPASDSEAADWLLNAFELKDQLLSNFKTQGQFPNVGTEEELSTLKCLVNFAVVVSSTAFFIYLTLFSSIWFRIYVISACALLSVVTYFKIQPTPVKGFVKEVFGCKKSN